MSKLRLTFGLDPELFVRQGGKRFLSAHNLLPGTKQEPHLVSGGAVQRDGVAAEFNTMPTDNVDDFVEVTNRVRRQMTEMIMDAAGPLGLKDLELVAQPTAYFDQEYFDALPDEIKVLGCTPDYNAYTGETNKPPETTEPFRTGAGHLHISWFEDTVDPLDPAHFAKCRDIVKQLDAVLYPQSEIWDTDRKRRTLYGAKGSFRPKFYGVEYRPLSNAFLRSDLLIRKVFKTADFAVRALFDGKKLFKDEEAEKKAA